MVYIGLGSNLGNRLANLQEAVELLRDGVLFGDICCSIILETDAILPLEYEKNWDSPYLNMVISGECKMSPHELLQKLKLIEQKFGRGLDYQKWAPRTIDLDILWWDGASVQSDNLTIPHPELPNRKFLLNLLQMMGLDVIKNMSHYGHHQPNASGASKLFLNTFVIAPKIIGILNITEDSFSDGGMYSNIDTAAMKAVQMVNDGASVIDIGAQSTRPGAIIACAAQEYERLSLILDALSRIDIIKNVKISIDTFHDEVVLKLLDKYDIALMNNVKGYYSDQAMRAIASNGCGIIMMHSLSVPPRADMVMADCVMENLITWGKQALSHALKFGFAIQDIILDPGIGFGKTAIQNIEIIRKIREMKKIGGQVLLGHSRKSLIGKFSNAEAAQRDIETIAISCLVKDRVDYLRVHNVKDHVRAFAVRTVVNL